MDAQDYSRWSCCMAKIIVNFSLRIPGLKQEIPYPGSFSLFEVTAQPNPREQPGDLSEDYRELGCKLNKACRIRKRGLPV
jgi:hypothetical protein